MIGSGIYTYPDTQCTVYADKGVRIAGSCVSSGGTGEAIAVYDISGVSVGTAIKLTASNAYPKMSWATFSTGSGNHFSRISTNAIGSVPTDATKVTLQADEKFMIAVSGMYKWPDITGTVMVDGGFCHGRSCICSGGTGSAIAAYDISGAPDNQVVNFSGSNTYGNMAWVILK